MPISQILSLDHEVNGPVTSILVIDNASLETVGKYICFAQFDDIIVKRDIYIAIHCKFKRMCKLVLLYDVSVTGNGHSYYSAQGQILVL